MWLGSGGRKRHSRRWNRTIITMIRTLIWSCLRRFPNSATTSTLRGIRAKGRSHVERIITESSIVRPSSSSSRKTDRWILTGPITSARQPRSPNYLSDISAPSAVFHPIIRALRAARDSAASSVKALTLRPAVLSLLAKRRIIEWSIINKAGGDSQRVEREKLSLSLKSCN